MSQKRENHGFTCEWCNARVLPVTNGSYRNHCPFCLVSKHVDCEPGDRRNTCQGLMKPIDLIYKPKKGYQLVHECVKCGATSVNKVAVDTIQPDDVLSWLRSKERSKEYT